MQLVLNTDFRFLDLSADCIFESAAHQSRSHIGGNKGQEKACYRTEQRCEGLVHRANVLPLMRSICQMGLLFCSWGFSLVGVDWGIGAR